MSSIPPPRVTPPPSVPPPQPEPAADHEEEVPWPIWTAPAAVLTGLLVGVFGSVLVAGIGAAAGSSKNSPAVNLISDFVFDVGFVLTALYFASLRRRPRPADFGYRRIAVMLGIGAVLAGGIGYYVVTAIYQALVHLHGTDKLPQSLGVGSSTAALVGAAVFVCVVAPIAEEFFFRGFIFGGLRRMHVVIGGQRHRHLARGGRSPGSCSASPTPARPPPSTSSRSASWASCCAWCAGGRDRSIRAWRSTRSTTPSPSASTSCTGTPARSSRCWRPR